MAASPLPLIVYYLAFAPVLTLNGKQKGATAEWQSHHIRISLPLVLLPALWLMSVFHYGLEQVLIMEEKWYTLAFWFGLGAIFIIAFVLRTPKTSAWRRAFHDRSVTPVGGRTDDVCR